jgi:hypothetical protein
MRFLWQASSGCESVINIDGDDYRYGYGLWPTYLVPTVMERQSGGSRGGACLPVRYRNLDLGGIYR